MSGDDKCTKSNQINHTSDFAEDVYFDLLLDLLTLIGTSLSSGVDILIHVHVLIVVVIVIVVLVVDRVDDGHREEGGGDEKAKEGEDDKGSTVAWIVIIPACNIEELNCVIKRS